MPYQPGVYFDPRAIYEGLSSAGHSLENRAQRDLQQRQQDLIYGVHAEDLAKDYYSIGQADKGREAQLQAQVAIENARLGDSAEDRKQRLLLERVKMDPRRAELMPSQTLPGTYVSPMTGQIVQPKPAKSTTPTKPLVQDVNGVKMWSSDGGISWKPAPAGNPMAAMLGGAGSQAQASPAQSTPAPSSSIAIPKTRAERDALPAGTRYQGPDGKTYIRQ